MPIRFVRDEDSRTLRAAAEGVVVLDDILDFVSAQDAEGAWSWRVLFDSRSVDLSAITRASVDRIAVHIAHVAQGRRRGPMAIVTHADLAPRISQIFVDLCSQVAGLVIGVFHDRSAAESWLERIPLEG